MPSEETAETIVANLASTCCDEHHRDSGLAPLLMSECGQCLVKALKSYASQEVEKQKRKDAEMAREFTPSESIKTEGILRYWPDTGPIIADWIATAIEKGEG